MSAPRAVSIDVLGPLRVAVDGGEQALTSRRQRALLTALVVRDRRPVSVGDLVDAVWEDEPPDRARTTLQTYVSRLRGLVGQRTILGSPAGYRLADGVATDLATARAAVAEIEMLEPGDPRAAQIAEQAVETWRGPALSEFDERDWFRGHAVELAEMRSNLIDIAAAGMIADGRCQQAVSLLQRSLASDPLREPTQLLLVRALHGAGRTTDAVRAASSYRQLLREETGLVAGPQFDAVEQLALTGAPEPGRATSGNDSRHDRSPPPDGAPRAGTTIHGPASGTDGWSSATLARPTALIGRSSELARIEASLRSSRLVSVVGTGGVGKTRLVAEHVERARSTQRVLVVELSAIASPDVLVTLGAHLGVREERIDLRTVAELLRPHEVLLVLDNAEHVVADVRELASTVLRSCPDVRMLVTSRERLDLADEVVVGVAPLPVDSPDAEAVTLFVDRMRRVRPHVDLDHDRPRILDICRRVDGMPLAIELAASRAASVGVDAVVDRFDALFGPLLGVAADADRHSTLGNVVSWSIDLLGEPAQDLLSALSIFSGEFTVEAAVAVGGAIDADSVPLLLGRLVDTSLVTEAKGAGRFRLLEMIRAVAGERLVRSGRRAEVQRAHAGWVAQCVAGVAADALGPRESGTSAAIDALRHELGHALDWAIGTGDIATAATITRALGGPVLYRPDADLIRQLRGLGVQRSIVGSPDEAVIVATDARAAFLLGDLEEVDALAHRAIALSADDRAARHRAEHALGVVRLYQGRFTESEELFLPASASPTADTAQHLDALGGLALARCYAGDTTGALAAAQQLAAAADTIDSDTYRAFADYALGELELANGEVDAAVARLAAAADRSWEVGARFVWGVASTVLARVLVRHRPAEEARRQLPTLIERWRHTTTWPQLWTTLRLTAEHLVATGQPSVALLIVEAAAVDPAAPTLSGDDLARRRLIRERVGDHLGAATVTGIARGAAAVERTTVVERALDALRHPIDG